MDPIASFGGLGSGIDFRSLVDEIIRAESAPLRRLSGRVAEVQERKGAYETFRSLLNRLESTSETLRAGDPFRSFRTSVSRGGVESTAVEASAGEGASPGTHEVSVDRLARREKMGGAVFASRTEALGLSGEFLVGGEAVRIVAGDSLEDVVDAFDAANTGSRTSGVSASLLELEPGAHQLVLTADGTGAEGIDLADGQGRVVRALGLLDETTEIKHASSDGALSDGFLSASDSVASLLELEQAPAAGAVTVGGFQATIDLSTMSLADVADEINAQAAAAGSSVTAGVVEEAVDGGSGYRLDISGTTAFADANGILETLGVLRGGRSSVAQKLESETAFTESDGTTPASGTTLLTDLQQGGSPAGVQAGDTLDLKGTRGDGTSVDKTFTVASDSTLQDLLDALNSATDGFQAGSATATASISTDGRLTLTDDQGGTSELALSVVANNEGGGTLDFGAMTRSVTGRSREIVDGRDARVTLDGTVFTPASNVLEDPVPGVTLRLAEVTSDPVTVQVERDGEAALSSVEAMIGAYNGVVDFVATQFSGRGAEDGVANAPLSGDAVLRQMRGRLLSAMQTSISPAVGGGVTRLADVGVEIDRDGRFQLDEAAFMEAMDADPAAVRRLFGVFGEGSTGSVSYLTGSDATVAGSYDVEITRAARRAAVTGTGFGGTYVDDGTGDTMTVRDLSSGSEYAVVLSDGDTLTDVVESLNSEFNQAQRQRLVSSETLFSDGSGTPATSATALADLHDSGGSNLGVAAGDTITLSGTAHDGGSVFRDVVVEDPTTETLGSLESSFQDALGSDVEVSISGGTVVVEALEAESSLLSLSLSSDNAGGGTLSFGTLDMDRAGRGTADITASDEGGELRLEHGSYGSAEGFEVAFTPGGTDGTGSLGLGAGTYAGEDVEGTLGGHAADGTGRILVGADGTEVEGLMIRHEAADTGLVGEVTFSRGVASTVEETLETLLGPGTGTVEGIVEGLDGQTDRIESRISRMEERLERRRSSLIQRFAALEEALADANARGEFLSAQLGSLSG